MKQRSRGDKLKENALVGFELALQLVQDQEFRQRLSSAIGHGKKAKRRAGRSGGGWQAARRLAVDQALQAELQDARRDLQQAYALVNAKKRGRRLRPITLLAGLASLAAVPEVRERLSALMATASQNGKHLQGLATERVPGGDDGRPRTLEALTKEELYTRAQEAEIPGRSEMSKEELVAALRAKS
jgi:hypothetical protein